MYNPWADPVYLVECLLTAHVYVRRFCTQNTSWIVKQFNNLSVNNLRNHFTLKGTYLIIKLEYKSKHVIQQFFPWCYHLFTICLVGCFSVCACARFLSIKENENDKKWTRKQPILGLTLTNLLYSSFNNKICDSILMLEGFRMPKINHW